MKLANIKGVSATVASLALVGTCFAAPAMAEQASSVFASTDASAEQAEAAAPEAATPEAAAVATPTLDAESQAALGQVLSALGFDQETIDAIVSADYSQYVSDIDSDQLVDAVSQAAQQVSEEYGIDADTLNASAEELALAVSEGLAELGIDGSTIDAAATELADAVSTAVGEFAGTVGSYLYEQGYLTDGYILYSGDSALSADEQSQVVEYAGLNFLVPSDFTGVTLTAEELDQALGVEGTENSLADVVDDGFVAISADSAAAVVVTQIKADQLEGFDAAQFASVAYSLPYFSASADGEALAFGGASLDDGTPVLAGSAQAQDSSYQVVIAPSESGSLVVFVMFGEEGATQADYDQLNEVALSLTGTGEVQTSGVMVIDGDATEEEVIEAALDQAASAESVDQAAEAAPAEEAK